MTSSVVRTWIVCLIGAMCIALPGYAEDAPGILHDFRNGADLEHKALILSTLKEEYKSQDIRIDPKRNKIILKAPDGTYFVFYLDEEIYSIYIDLNGDGVEEFLFFHGHSMFCGSVGCSVHVFQQQDGLWNKIGGITTRSRFRVSDKFYKGWKIISSGLFCYYWNGDQYVSPEFYPEFFQGVRCKVIT